jgi:hypothetical protein
VGQYNSVNERHEILTWSTYRGVLEAKGLNQVLGGILHPVSHLEDMLVSLEVCPLGALKDKNDEDWK